MAQAKKKAQAKIQKKAKAIVNNSKAKKQETTGSLAKVWKEEVSELREIKFSSLEDAVSAIADRVIARLNFGSGNNDRERSFLINLLSTDPSITNELRRTLKIS